ncbi:MAG: response regulator transcription factor [Nitrospinae bacterium]|nr:response regulator transcription factor [Nitrospinota bacterium]
MSERKDSAKIKILIADDHPIFRQGLKHAFSDTPDLEVAGEASNGAELLEKVRTGAYHVVLLDISMGGKSSLETLKQLKVERPKMAVLVLSVYPEDQYAMRFIRAGASGYLTKESVSDQLMEAVRKVARGGRYVSHALTEKLAFDFADHEKLPHEYLSDREYQVFCMIGAGKSLTEIGKELSLSVKTVGTHRTHILEKMKMRNNAQLIQYAILNQLV